MYIVLGLCVYYTRAVTYYKINALMLMAYFCLCLQLRIRQATKKLIRDNQRNNESASVIWHSNLHCPSKCMADSFCGSRSLSFL